VIAVCRRIPTDDALVIAEALAEGGISVIEVTMEQAGAADTIGVLADSGVTVGAGTVVGVDRASMAVDAGARFLVSPGLDPDVVAWSRDHRVPHLPGVLTPSEVTKAIGLGVMTLKLFPASLGGPSYLRSLLAPFPGVEFIPSGGIDETNAAAYLDAGAIAVGVGGVLAGMHSPAEVTSWARRLTQVV
jgi:2-dehydro-3-deoxyphosphogluconate aldolase/(4S)-4-hydroxy-2-oxoglutarate aldolase